MDPASEVRLDRRDDLSCSRAGLRAKALGRRAARKRHRKNPLPDARVKPTVVAGVAYFIQHHLMGLRCSPGEGDDTPPTEGSLASHGAPGQRAGTSCPPAYLKCSQWRSNA
jgi:hypothetical protein